MGALAVVDLSVDRVGAVGGASIRLVGEDNAADGVVEHVVHDAHEDIGISTAGTVNAAVGE